MNEVDPYETSPVSCPNVAALVIGRSLARFAYYLSQAVLLTTGEYVPEGQRSSLAQAQRALESIYARARCLRLDQSDEICDLLRDCSDEITGAWFSGACCEAVTWLESECNYDHDKDTERQDVVNQFATPWRKRIDKAIRSAKGPDRVKWFELGLKLEEGLCRPDVFRFQIPFKNNLPVLRPDNYSMPYLESLHHSCWSDDEDRAAREHATEATLSSVAYVRRDPGDLVPHRFWWHDVERVWTAAGLGVVHLSELRTLGKAKAQRRTITAMLSDSVEKLFRAAHFAAGKGLERLRVDLENSLVELDGIAYPEEKEVVALFHCLKAEGGATTFPRVKAEHPDIYGPHDKLIRVLKKTSTFLAAVIGHSKGRKITLEL